MDVFDRENILTRRANHRHNCIIAGGLSRTLVVLSEPLDCFDDGAIEEEYLSAFGLVLERFHHAVADRHAIIDTRAPGMPRDARAIGRGRMAGHRKRSIEKHHGECWGGVWQGPVKRPAGRRPAP